MNSLAGNFERRWGITHIVPFTTFEHIEQI